jgi:hypothetical protein
MVRRRHNLNPNEPGLGVLDDVGVDRHEWTGISARGGHDHPVGRIAVEAPPPATAYWQRR